MAHYCRCQCHYASFTYLLNTLEKWRITKLLVKKVDLIPYAIPQVAKNDLKIKEILHSTLETCKERPRVSNEHLRRLITNESLSAVKTDKPLSADDLARLEDSQKTIQCLFRQNALLADKNKQYATIEDYVALVERKIKNIESEYCSSTNYGDYLNYDMGD